MRNNKKKDKTRTKPKITMKRAFSQFSTVLSKAENEDLRSTLRLLTKGSSTIGETIQGGNHLPHRLDATTKTSAQTDKKHVDTILKVLNSTLPDPKRNIKRINTHYDVLFGQLQKIITESIATSSPSSSPKARNTASLSSDQLYDRLMLLQYTNELKISDIIKILLSKNFQKFPELLSNINVFKPITQLEILIIAYYRTKDVKLLETYNTEWLHRYHDLHVSIQRILWKCQPRTIPIEDIIEQIPQWSAPKDFIIMYQSLYTDINRLPMVDESLQGNFTKNQKIFIDSLRIVDKFTGVTDKTKQWLIQIVKLSIEDKLTFETVEHIDGKNISLYQFKFLRSLELILQNFQKFMAKQELAVQENESTRELLNELQGILEDINTEEQEIKTQISLKFI